MRPAVVTAVLLLVGTLNPVKAQAHQYRLLCRFFERPCDDGWSPIDDDRCAKYFDTPRTFQEAKEHCRSVDADLMSVHNDDEMHCLLYLSRLIRSSGVWIGVQRAEGRFRYTDGSEFDYDTLLYVEPANSGGQEDCIAVRWWRFLFDANCSEEKSFMCAKKL